MAEPPGAPPKTALTLAVPPGSSRAAAEELAAALARFPQVTLRGDRASALAAGGLEEDAALAVEWREGAASLGAAVEGARRFAGGAGRHGAFD